MGYDEGMGDRISAKTYTAIALALLFWASAFPGIRAGLQSAHSPNGYAPGQLALLRFGTASIALALYALVTRMRLPDRRDLPVIALAGFLGISFYHVALNFGEQTVPSAAAALIISSSPVFTALFSTRFLGERLSALGWAGVAASFVGVVIISAGHGQGLSLDPNALLILGAAVATSVYMTVSKRPLARYSGLEFTSYCIWAGTIPMLVFLPGLVGHLPNAPFGATAAGVYLGVFPGAIGYVLWSVALKRMPATSLAVFLNFQPVNAAIIAWFWLREVPSLLTWVGGGIAVLGVVLVERYGQAGARASSAHDVPTARAGTDGETR